VRSLIMSKLNLHSYPDPPVGYRPAVQFHYPKLKLQIAALGVVVLVLPVLLFLAWIGQGRPAGLFLGGISQPRDVLVALVTVVSITIIHEWVHGLAYRLLGYRVVYGASLHLGAAYAAAFGQWQTRDHNAVVALAPLVMLTLALAPLLLVPHPTVALAAIAALLMNIGGAVGDVYLAWRLLRLPRAALLYDVDVKTMLIYVPEP
jgi:hypothetical protein